MDELEKIEILAHVSTFQDIFSLFSFSEGTSSEAVLNGGTFGDIEGGNAMIADFKKRCYSFNYMFQILLLYNQIILICRWQIYRPLLHNLYHNIIIKLHILSFTSNMLNDEIMNCINILMEFFLIVATLAFTFF